MRTLTDYLELCKDKKGFKKDTELADFLGIKRASLSVMKHGGGASQETAERIASGAGVSLEEVWLASLIQKEENPRFKIVLENISKRAGIAASISFAAAYIPYFATAIYNQVCILCKIRSISILSFVGIVLELALPFTTWSQFYGSKKKNQFLSYAQ